MLFLNLLFLVLVGLQVPSCGVAFLCSRGGRGALPTRHHRGSSAFLSSSTQPIPEKSIDNQAPATFDWERQWYPLAVDGLLDRSRPQAMKLLGKDLVLWHDGFQWKALEDYCPHRAVPLSEGRIELDKSGQKPGELMCAYHAWRFDGRGQCTAMPQADFPEKEKKLLQNPRSCAKAYPVQIEQGLIWVWGMSGLPGSDVMIESALKSPRLMEELTDPSVNTTRLSVFVYDVRDLPYGWDYFMENTLDASHVVVSHHGRAGNRYRDAKPLNLTRVPSRSEIPIAEGGDFNPAFPMDAGFKFLSNPINPRFNAYTTVDFRPPCLNKIENVRKDGAKFILGAYATPTAPGYCRHISATIIIQNEDNKKMSGLKMFSSKLIPLWLVHLSSSLFVMQDMLFLHKQERKLHQQGYAFGHFAPDVQVSSDSKVYAKGLFLPNNQDQPVMAIRNWISQQAGGGPSWGPGSNRLLPPVLQNADLFNVFEIHTKNCQVCLQAVKQLKTLRIALVALGALVVWKFRFSKKAISVLMAAITAVLYAQLSRVIRMFYIQEYSHQDNN